MNKKSFDVNEFRITLRICILHLDLSINYLHKGEIDDFFVTYKLLIKFLSEVIGQVGDNKVSLCEMNLFVEPDYFLMMFSECMLAQKQKDYILLADLLEMKMRPLLIEIMTGILNYSNEDTQDDTVELNLNVIKTKDVNLANMIRECLCGMKKKCSL
jgi:hypothetical protein